MGQRTLFRLRSKIVKSLYLFVYKNLGTFENLWDNSNQRGKPRLRPAVCTSNRGDSDTRSRNVYQKLVF